MNDNLQNPPAATADWSPGPLLDQAELLGVHVAAWNNFTYPQDSPKAGARNAAGITAGHGAVEVIDEILRDLYRLRCLLIGELRADEDARAIRVDAMLAAGGAR